MKKFTPNETNRFEMRIKFEMDAAILNLGYILFTYRREFRDIAHLNKVIETEDHVDVCTIIRQRQAAPKHRHM